MVIGCDRHPDHLHLGSGNRSATPLERLLNSSLYRHMSFNQRFHVCHDSLLHKAARPLSSSSRYEKPANRTNYAHQHSGLHHLRWFDQPHHDLEFQYSLNRPNQSSLPCPQGFCTKVGKPLRPLRVNTVVLLVSGRSDWPIPAPCQPAARIRSHAGWVSAARFRSSNGETCW